MAKNDRDKIERWIKQQAGTGKSGNEIYREMRQKFGTGIRRSDFYKVLNEAKARTQARTPEKSKEARTPEKSKEARTPEKSNRNSQREQKIAWLERMAKTSNMSTNELEKAMREKFGSAIRRSDLQRIVAQARGYQQRQDRQKYTRREYRKFNMFKDPILSREWNGKYNHYIVYRVRNKATGKVYDKWIIIQTNRPMKMKDLLDRAEAILDANESSYDPPEQRIGPARYSHTIIANNPVAAA
jgi:hypothetical protein